MTEETNQFTPNSITEDVGVAPKKRVLLKLVLAVLAFGLLLALLLVWRVISLNQPTLDFPVNQPIIIESGTEVRGIAKLMADNDFVQSEFILYLTLILFHEPKEIKASTYIFEQPLTTREVAVRLTQGDFDSDLVRFTHFEGERATTLAKRASEKLPNFDSANFSLAAEPLEGRLFPETYFVPNDFDDEQLLKLLIDTFDAEIHKVQHLIDAHTLSLEEILILASIIEREANSTESKKMVSSVLQNRLEIDMPLQADASIEYVLEKPLAELTPEDLEIDSPYNTYLYKGLPPTPIGNPGLEAIMAVLEPSESDYFYYITDEEGEFHFAKTYSEHLRNIDTYLR